MIDAAANMRIFPDDPWEYPYAANRAFNSAQQAREKLQAMDPDDPRRAAEQASLRFAKMDFAIFNAGFDFYEDKAYSYRHRQFIVNNREVIDIPTGFTVFIEGQTSTTNLPEVRAILEDTKSRLGQLGSSLTVYLNTGELAGNIASGIDVVTLEYLHMSLDEVFGLYAKNPDFKKVTVQARNSLQHLGLKTLKDLVAFGPDGTADTPNVGTRSQSLIDHIIQRYDLQDIWQQANSVERAALLYHSLDEVPQVLASRRRIGYSLRDYTVGDILQADVREVARIISPGQPDMAYAQNIIDLMSGFEQKFYQARRRLLRGLAKPTEQ